MTTIAKACAAVDKAEEMVGKETGTIGSCRGHFPQEPYREENAETETPGARGHLDGTAILD
jgi:hypothetical protein